ncbi:MAG: SDR family NAD(P)-dependent oxidoreductase [Bacteroidota bacterium]
MKKTILITGSTDGIGKLAAIKLAHDGHEIYLHGRNPEKLAAVISEIKTLTKNTNLKGFVADFSNLEDVKEMAQQVKNDVAKIDVLINNAGVFKSAAFHNKDGLDLRYVVNYFAPYLLTRELVPLLKNGTAARIINLSSAAQAPVVFEVLSGQERQSNQATYAQSKLALTMWSFHLAKTLKDIAVIAVNPGSLLNTNMVKEGYGYHWSSAEKGGNLLYELAISEEYEGVTGKYFDNDQGDPKGTFGEAHSDAYSETTINKLIEVTENILFK